MISNALNLTESYTTKKVKFGEKKEPKTVENIPVIFEKDLPQATAHKMKCSAIPVVMGSALATAKVAGGTGLFDKLAPVLLPILYDAGRIIFYVNGAKAIYRMCGGDTKGAIRQFKDVAMGYALLIGLDGIMYFIEYYVEGLKDGMLEGVAQTANMMMNMLGGIL